MTMALRTRCGLWSLIIAGVLLAKRLESKPTVGANKETATPSDGSTCDRYISSDTSKNGTFSSPNYPESYPPNMLCTYHFSGRGKERVQLIFTDFNLPAGQEDNQDCEDVDAVVAYITTSNGLKERVDNFCGSDLPVQLMSNGPSMTLVLHSLHAAEGIKGFRGIYRFLTNFGITGGRQDLSAVCLFIFNSTEKSNGTFTTPNYPGYYPRDTECHYFFYGRPNERVHINFVYFDVEGVPSCTSDTASDYVEFSNYRTVDRKIPRHCGAKKPKNIESDSDFFRIAFKSNDKFDGTGFEAFYQFKTYIDPYTIKRVSVQPSVGSRSSQQMVPLYSFWISAALMFSPLQWPFK